MYTIVLIIVFTLLFVALSKGIRGKDFFHPLILYIVPFFLQYTIYYVLLDNSTGVDVKTLKLYIFSILLFVGSYSIAETISAKVIKGKVKLTLPLQSRSYPFYKFVIIITALGVFYEIIIYGFATNTSANNIYDAMAWHINWGGGYNVLTKYLLFFYGVVYAFFVYNYMGGKRRDKVRFVLATVVAYFFAIASFSRTQIMLQTLSLAYILMFKNRKRIFSNSKKILKVLNKIMLGIIALLVIFTITAKLTNKTGSEEIFNKNFYLWSYFSAQLKTLDKYVINHPGVSEGYHILGFISKLLGKDTNFKEFLPTINEFNVFSYIGIIYLDCGYYAYLFQCLLGILVAIIYNMNLRRGGYWTIFYSYYAFAIFMSFYAYQYSLTIYIYILLAFLVIKIIDMCRIKIK